MAEPAAQESLAGAIASPLPSSPPAHQPYIPDHVTIPEFTWPAVLVGAVLGIVFGASSLYLVLKVGMTVSASIPVAVLSITLFRVFTRVFGFRRATILENNIVQTAGSAGESVAFGIGVTMPALMLLGFEMEISRVMVAGVLGGALGILMMIPLRRAFIVKQHGTLKYPEGTACADVLIVGEQGGTSAKTVFTGFGIAFVYQFLWRGMQLWKETVTRSLHWFQGALPALEVNPTLLGVGYIIGTRISCIMVAGGALAAFVLVPLIHFFGSGLHDPLFPGTVPISSMSMLEIGDIYVVYIGAGAVAAGGIISLFRALPLIGVSIMAAARDLRGGNASGAASGGARRTDRDLPLSFVGIGSLVLLGLIWASLPTGSLWSLVINLVAAVLIVLFGFLFVTVSSRLTGEIGSSSNPISGMTVATLLLTCLIFLAVGWTDHSYRLVALSIAAIVCVASSNGGTTSQDLKTGFLVGATPKYQQYAILVGSISSALVIGWILIALNQANTVYTTKKLPHLTTPLAVTELPERAVGPDGKSYHVWHALEGNPQGAPAAKYYVGDDGQLRYHVDPGINGTVSHRDDGTEVLKFKQPQSRLIALITDGILNQKLPWTLVLLGVSIALVLELSGVPSLPFAVGVYLPLSSSTPIFVGGLVRYVADRWGRGNGGQPRSAAESEMSPGVLMATGYIAGGAMAGVLVAFLSFNDTIPKILGRWQFREQTITVAKPLDEEYEDAAASTLGLRERPEPKSLQLQEMAAEIKDLNTAQLPRYVLVPAGTKLTLPKDKIYVAPKRMTLGEIAAAELGDQDNASSLLDLNEDPAQAARSAACRRGAEDAAAERHGASRLRRPGRGAGSCRVGVAHGGAGDRETTTRRTRSAAVS